MLINLSALLRDIPKLDFVHILSFHQPSNTPAVGGLLLLHACYLYVLDSSDYLASFIYKLYPIVKHQLHLYCTDEEFDSDELEFEPVGLDPSNPRELVKELIELYGGVVKLGEG